MLADLKIAKLEPFHESFKIFLVNASGNLMYNGAVTASSAQCKVHGSTGRVILLEVEHCNQQPELRQPLNHRRPLHLGGQSQTPTTSEYRYCFICEGSLSQEATWIMVLAEEDMGLLWHLRYVMLWCGRLSLKMAPGHPVGISSCSWSSKWNSSTGSQVVVMSWSTLFQ